MASITRWDPFRELTDFSRSMHSPFGFGFVRSRRLVVREHDEGLFPIDLYETEDEVVVKASLPGVRPENVKVSVEGSVLSIKAEAEDEDDEEQTAYYRRERRGGAYQRALRLPTRVDAEDASAEFEHGVLNLRLRKAADMRPKTIEVKANGATKTKSK